jgi:hypothetical protein
MAYSRFNGAVPITQADANENTAVVRSFTYTFPPTSATGNANDIIDATLLNVGEIIELDVPAKTSADAGYVTFTNGGFSIAKTEIVGNAVK